MDDSSHLFKAKKKIQFMKEEQQVMDGEEKACLKQLKKHGFDSIDVAKEQIETISKQISKLNKRISKRTEKLENKYEF